MPANFVDFAELKQRVGIEQVLDMLGIKLRGEGPQLRGPCPIHHGTKDREFVVTPAKGLWYCFTGCGGGDIIKLVAKIKNVGQKEAAEFIAKHFGTVPGAANAPVPSAGKSTIAGTRTAKEKEALKPLDYLQVEHELISIFGLSPETCREFGAGYAPKGIMRGRFAIPIHDQSGTLLAYCGHTLKNESPRLIFPNGFDSASVIFGAYRVEEGPLFLVKEPLDLLVAFEHGVTNLVCFLAEVTPQSLEMLASLMDQRKCLTLEFYAS